MSKVIWVRGVVGRLARIEKGGDWVSTEVAVPAPDNASVRKKIRQGDLVLHTVAKETKAQKELK